MYITNPQLLQHYSIKHLSSGNYCDLFSCTCGLGWFCVCRPEEEFSSTEVGGQEDRKPGAEAGMWGGTSAGSSAPLGHLSDEELFSLSFTELRDKLLAFDPLNKAHVIKVCSLSSSSFSSSSLHIKFFLCICHWYVKGAKAFNKSLCITSA